MGTDTDPAAVRLDEDTNAAQPARDGDNTRRARQTATAVLDYDDMNVGEALLVEAIQYLADEIDLLRGRIDEHRAEHEVRNEEACNADAIERQNVRGISAPEF